MHPPALLTPLPTAEESDSEASDGPPALSSGDALEARKLSTLVDVSQALAGHLSLTAALGAMLLILQRRCSVVRGLVALLDESSGKLDVRTSIGLDGERHESQAGKADDVLSQVLATGEAVVIPALTGESRLAGRTPSRRGQKERDFSLVCVPILLHRRTIGALALELQYRPEREFDRLLKFLRVVASMVSQAVRIHRLLDAERHKLASENAQLRQELRRRFHFPDLIGTSGPMRQLYEEVARVASTSTTVLIRGESGTGKELIAQAIHLHSPRAAQAFVKVNCAALPETLVESELFGHERGAFTGAQQRKQGRFELADGGTIFLDEIGELSPSTQVKLLRVLQEREFERVGGTAPVRVDVRVIAATNRNLELALAESHFRDDLYYRLNVFPIFIPPLRARKADVLPLADHFVEKYARAHGKQIERISSSAIELLSSYQWPGNVRELENTIERAVLLADGEVIHGHHLPPTLQGADAAGATVSASLGSAVEAFERSLIEDALKSTRGNRSRAARLLNTTERVIGYKVKKYGIDPAGLRE